MNCLEQLLEAHDVLLVDGATGTELFRTNLEPGDAPERLNVSLPDIIVANHAGYIEAGSDIVLTNSFGGTAYRLRLHDLDNQVFEINKAAAANARAAADAVDRVVLVAGSMGPTGELLVPMGSLTFEAAVEAFATQASGLAAGGADVLWIETMSSLEEAEAAVVGAQSVCDLPIVATFSFDTAGRTMMGVTGRDVAERLLPLGVAAVGCNCGANLTDSELAVAQMREAAPDALLVSKANAGIPEWHGAELAYSGSPEIMAAHAHRAKAAGAKIIGACCGSHAEHIAHMSDVLKGRSEVPDVEAPAASIAGTARPRGRRGRRAQAR